MVEFAVCGASAVYRCVTSRTVHPCPRRHQKKWQWPGRTQCQSSDVEKSQLKDDDDKWILFTELQRAKS